MKNDSSNIAGVQTVVQTIINTKGTIAPSELVDAARPKDSPAHSAFEWDNRKAGEQWRLTQARNYIRVVRVQVAEQPERLVHVPRVDAAADAGREGHYRPLSVLITRPDEFRISLEAATAKLSGAQSALDELHQAAEKDGRPDAAAAIAQMSRATQLFRESLKSLH